MNLQTKFLREFTKQIILTINPEILNQENKNLSQNRTIMSMPQMSNQIINQIKNPGLETYITPNTSIETIAQEINQEEYEDENKLHLGKVSIINDPSISMLECHGPKKFISLKRKGQVISTNISLNNEEIERIIDSFSRMSKIPRIGGVFKAIVDNLIITAIESPTGKRFMISKVPQ